MKRFIGLLCLLLAPAAWATTTVSGKIQTLGTGNVTSGAFVRFWLRGCAGNQPRVNGTSVIGPTQGGVFFFDIAADASGSTSGTIYSTRDNAGTGNGDIECGGSKLAVWYGMQIFVAGKGGPETPVHAKSGATLDITQVTPITTNPVITSPTGDSTYLRLDAGNSPVTGNLSVLGQTTILCKQLNPSWLCADQFPGTDASAKIQAAIAALPAVGGTVNALNLSDAGGTGSTIIDPGARSVTLLLGPYTYQIQQLVLETNFHVIGAGDGNWGASSTSTTVLQACATCAATNTVVLGTNGGNGGPIQHASMEGLRIYGATADSAIGMNLKTVNGANTGIWYSSFRNMCVGTCGPSGASANGFTGGAIVLDATGANTINQFLDFHNVFASKTNGGSPALSLLGTNGQITFTDSCEFDGTTRNDGTNVVQIANSSGNGGPYSITFVGATVQHGTTGINIAGAFSLTFIDTHFENVGGGFLVNSGVSSEISAGITVIGSTCQNACGNNTGAGYFAKTTTPNAVSVKFIGNQIQNSVDANYVGFTNIQNFVSIGDESDTLTVTTPLPNLFGQQITYKTGSGGGDYTTTSTNYVQVDGTNLLASIFIPTGWKLVVSASGAIQSDTAAAQVFTAIADGGTPTVVNTSLVGAATNPTNFALNTVIAGNGATHSVDLRFKTAVGADAAHILNSAGNGIPQMVFTLMPSN